MRIGNHLPNFKSAAQSGMSLLGVVIAAASGLAILGALSGGMAGLFKAQHDLNLHTELAEQLKNIKMRTDCAATLDGIDYSSVPAEGQPIELKSYPTGATLIAKNGSTFGRQFSFLADVLPDHTISIRAALLADTTSNPRSFLSAGPTAFKLSPNRQVPWDWAFSNNLIQRNLAGVGSICGDSAAAGGGNVQITCSDGVPASVTTCYVMNTATGETCSFRPDVGQIGNAPLMFWKSRQRATPAGQVVRGYDRTQRGNLHNSAVWKEMLECTKFVSGEMRGQGLGVE